jgi:hypothetical protein
MGQYRIFDLDPASDIDDALERYAKAGWHTWAAGRGAVVVVNGVRVHRVTLRRDATPVYREPCDDEAGGAA